MSHDRGCPCGREPYEYDECRDPACGRRQRAERSRVLTRSSQTPTGDEVRRKSQVVLAAVNWRNSRDIVLASPQGDQYFKHKLEMLSEAESQLSHAVANLMGDEGE